ncbi:MAG: VWA domain-containing protein [Planctomycetota bacterium]
MKFSYSEFDGQGFLSPDQLFAQPQVMNFILQYGEQALDAMQNLDNEEEQDFVQAMIDAGLLEEYEDEDGNTKLRMTGRMVRGFQHRALLEIFADMKKGSRDGHQTRHHGRTTERADGTKPYEFGDPISELELGQTLRNAIARQTAERAAGTGHASGGARLPIGISSNDFELHMTEGSADCATVMLIDLSGSMMRYGRFIQAKRIALGMQELIRGRFPQDTLEFVGFYSLADKLDERDVPLIMPKPVSIRDYEVRIRVPLEQARANVDKIPQHFTNLQLGLRTARQMLARSGAANKQIFVITDGQPTAHVAPGNYQSSPESGGPASGGEEMLYLLYPPTEETSNITLQEAMQCSRQGIRIATFALIEDYWGMDWVGFVDRLTRLTRGLAYYCTSEDLSSTVIESYLTGKKTKSFVH